MYQLKVVQGPERTLLGLPHRGPYPEIGPVFAAMFDAIGEAGLLPRIEAMIGVYFDDPGRVAPADLRAFAGVQVPAGVTSPPTLEVLTLAAGPHAMLRLQGPYAGLPEAWAYLYGDGMSATGRTPSDAPSFELYLNDPTDTLPEDLVTELWAPLA